MRVLMISDAHLEGLDDPGQVEFVRWLDAAQADRLVLLGDLFHYWWGYPEVVWGPYVPVVAALLRARARGVSLVFVPGNHDFAVGTFLTEQVGLQVREPGVLQLGASRFLLSHGDEVDGSLGYRATCALLRGRAFGLWMRALGPVRGYALLRRLAGASRGRGAPPTALLEAQRRWADQRLGRDADVVVMGHIHVPTLERRGLGVFVNLGDWVEHRTWLEVQDDRLRLMCGLEGQVLAEEVLSPLARPAPASPGLRGGLPPR